MDIFSYTYETMDAKCPEASARLTEQLLRYGQVDERRVDVAMTEVGREVRQARLRIDPVAIPREHPMHDEAVAQVVHAWPRPATGGFEAGLLHHPMEQLLSRAVGISEEACLRMVRPALPLARFEVVTHDRHDGRLKRQPSRLEEFGFEDVDGSFLDSDIPNAQPDEFAYAQAGTVGKAEHRIQGERPQGRIRRRESPSGCEQLLEFGA